MPAALAGQPLSVTLKFDPGVVNKQIQGSRPASAEYRTARVFCLWPRVEKFGIGQLCRLQDAGQHACGLPKREAKTTFTILQNWIGASQILADDRP